MHLFPSKVSEKYGGRHIHSPGWTHFSLAVQSASDEQDCWICVQAPLMASPTVPKGQEHENDPTVFEQIAPGAQAFESDSHSLMSKK